jgi:adapter protein MecA 1/2
MDMHPGFFVSYDIAIWVSSQGATCMKLERLDQNKFKIFLTFDDLMDHGLSLEEIREHSLKAQRIFQHMIEDACDEMNFKMNGAIEIEIFSLHAQGLIIIVSREDEEDLDDEDYLNFQVKLGEHAHILYVFLEFEDIIQLAHRLKVLGLEQGQVFLYQDRYYIYIDDVEPKQYKSVISLTAEYGNASTLTLYKIQEYGKLIFEKSAIKTITEHFMV